LENAFIKVEIPFVFNTLGLGLSHSSGETRRNRSLT